MMSDPPNPNLAPRPLASPSTEEAIPRLPWRELLALFLASRLIIWALAGLSLRGVNKGPHFTPTSGPLDWFMRWDALWYLELAQRGYFFTENGDRTNVVFLPLYPALVWLVSLGGLIPTAIAGYVVSLACLWVACLWLWRAVAREWQDARLATVTVALLLFGPVSFFFSTLYSEALFLPLVIGCIAFARERRWWVAGMLGALAASTRFIGVVLIVPLGWEYLSAQRPARDAQPSFRWTPLLACTLPLIGFGAYCLLMWAQFGDPLMYFRGQLHWGRKIAWWWDLFARESFTGQPVFYQIWFAATVVCALGLLAAGAWLRLPSTYLVLGLTFSGVYISSRFVEALPRYFSVVFPLYIVLALIARRWPDTAVALFATSAVLQALSVTLFVNGYWFT